MGNIWKIVMFIWKNKDMLWAVIQEIMDLFKADPASHAKVYAACEDCRYTPRLGVLDCLGKEASKHNKNG